jgi:hypothetical protein
MTRYPAAARFPAIAVPMWPRPIEPISPFAGKLPEGPISDSLALAIKRTCPSGSVTVSVMILPFGNAFRPFDDKGGIKPVRSDPAIALGF